MDLTRSFRAFARVSLPRISGRSTFRSGRQNRGQENRPASSRLVTFSFNQTSDSIFVASRSIHSSRIDSLFLASRSIHSSRIINAARAFPTYSSHHSYHSGADYKPAAEPVRRHLWNYDEERELFALSVPDYYNFCFDKVCLVSLT